jgi:hypothetical protein
MATVNHQEEDYVGNEMVAGRFEIKGLEKSVRLQIKKKTTPGK